jgi:hypothetical protein
MYVFFFITAVMTFVLGLIGILPMRAWIKVLLIAADPVAYFVTLVLYLKFADVPRVSSSTLLVGVLTSALGSVVLGMWVAFAIRRRIARRSSQA